MRLMAVWLRPVALAIERVLQSGAFRGVDRSVRVTTRRMWLSWSQAYPYQTLFRRVYENLIRLAPIFRPTPTPLRC